MEFECCWQTDGKISIRRPRAFWKGRHCQHQTWSLRFRDEICWSGLRWHRANSRGREWATRVLWCSCYVGLGETGAVGWLQLWIRKVFLILKCGKSMDLSQCISPGDWCSLVKWPCGWLQKALVTGPVLCHIAWPLGLHPILAAVMGTSGLISCYVLLVWWPVGGDCSVLQGQESGMHSDSHSYRQEFSGRTENHVEFL